MAKIKKYGALGTSSIMSGLNPKKTRRAMSVPADPLKLGVKIGSMPKMKTKKISLKMKRSSSMGGY